MSNQDRGLVVVTGATGFIAQHCIAQLLDQGYHVRGTLRDLSKAEALAELFRGQLQGQDRLSFVQADLLKDDGWEQSMSGARFLLHTASPVPVVPPQDENELVRPALDGTLRVLRAAANAHIEKVVLTSSVAAILSGTARTPQARFNEDDWSDLDGDIQAYAKSKTLAERAAWDFQAQLPADQRFALVTINPVYVLGPSIDGHPNASNEIVRKLLDREVPGLPRLFFPTVDVRDVAAAHLLALQTPDVDGQRFIVNAHDVWYADIAGILAGAGHAVPRLRIPDWLVHVVSWFDPTVRLVIKDIGWDFYPSSQRARQVLGWTTRELSETVLDTADSILARRVKAR